MIYSTIPAAEPISVDLTTTYQTFDGLGCFPTMPTVYIPAGQFWLNKSNSYYYDQFADMGNSLVRFQLNTYVYPHEGQPYDWAGIVTGTGGAVGDFQEMRELKKRGINRFIFSVWTPPAWMKANNAWMGPGEGNLGAAGNENNYLLPKYYGAMASFVADYLKTVKDSTGVEPYAVSLQNEPLFQESYESCVYWPNQLDSLIRLTAPKLQAAGLATRIYGAEHMMSFEVQNWGSYDTVMKADPNVYAFAVHGYTDGVHAYYGNAPAWQNLATFMGQKKLWMTETPIPYPFIVPTAQCLSDAINGGNLSGWTWFTFYVNFGQTTLDANTQVPTSWAPHLGFYACKNYFKFIRPDAIRVKATSSDQSLLITAVKNTDAAVAVVIANTGGGDQTVSLAGTGLPSSWIYYTTSNSLNCAKSGNGDGTNIPVPAGSIVTAWSGAAIPNPPDRHNGNIRPCPATVKRCR